MSRISKKKILEYHYKNTDECVLGCDADEWHHRCWRCGYIRNLERCHIIPKSLGGKNTPDNYVLLCNDCHQEAPNVKDETFMFEWIENTCISTYNTFWDLRNIFQETLKECSTHFGHGNKLNKSSKEWAYNEFIKKLGKKKYYLIGKNGENFINSLKYINN
tara:strand:+ start:42 stop:524 length:483 start_codon:yes stop_codon:yes gene_type:complete